MNDLHAVFRSTGDSWEVYSRPVSIHASGRSLDLARDEFTRAAGWHFQDEWDAVEVHNHTERQVGAGVYARTAVDRFTLEREHAERVLRQSLTVPEQMDDLRSYASEASTGDFVFACCVASDPISWIVQQLGRTDSLQVCMVAPGEMLWWITLASPESDFLNDDSETLGEAGLAGESATIGDLFRAESQQYDPYEEELSSRLHRRGPRRNRPAMRSRGRTLVVA